MTPRVEAWLRQADNDLAMAVRTPARRQKKP